MPCMAEAQFVVQRKSFMDFQGLKGYKLGYKRWHTSAPRLLCECCRPSCIDFSIGWFSLQVFREQVKCFLSDPTDLNAQLSRVQQWHKSFSPGHLFYGHMVHFHGPLGKTLAVGTCRARCSERLSG